MRQPAEINQNPTIWLTIASFLLYAYISEIVFGGPLGVFIGILSIRKALFIGIMAMYVLHLLYSKSINIKGVFLAFIYLVSILVWGVFIPSLKEVAIEYSLAESVPAASFLILFPIKTIFGTFGANNYVKWGEICAILLSGVVSVAWFLADVLDRPSFAYSIKDLYVLMSGSDHGLYIGEMADGSFRVMWISIILLPFIFIYKNTNGFNPFWSVFYMLGIIGSGTRAFLIPCVIYLLVSIFRSKISRGILGVAVVAVTVAFVLVLLDQRRIFDVISEFNGDSVRISQMNVLLKLFIEHPIFGAGLGASAVEVRSESSVFSYELTYFALLAKIGVVGSVIIILFLFNVTRRLLVVRPDRKVNTIYLVFTFIFVTSSNPYLLTLVGSLLGAVLIACGLTPGDSRSDFKFNQNNFLR